MLGSATSQAGARQSRLPDRRARLFYATLARMDIKSDPRIVSSDRLDNAIVVSFADGRTALYSAALLDSIFPQAEDVTHLPADQSMGQDTIQPVTSSLHRIK